MRLNGVAYDRHKAAMLEAELQEEVIECEKVVHETMKPLPKLKRLVSPFKTQKSGYTEWSKHTISALGEEKLEYLYWDEDEKVSAPFSLIHFPEFNLGSTDQVADQLIRRGWKPKVFTPTGKPQVNEKVLSGVSIPECVLINKYLMLSKRLTDIKKWNDYSDKDPDGLIHGYVDPLGTNTTRMSHSSPNMGQVTSVDKPYGKEQRELFITRSPDRVIVGSDASGLEARCLAHRIDDEEFTNSILRVDIHTFNQQFFSVPTRNGAKPVYYCLVYGGGDKKFGSILGGSAKLGKELRDKYYTRFPKLGAIQKKYGNFSKGDKLRAIDGRYVNVREPHSSLNLDLQSMGAIICKYWMIDIMTQIRKEGLDALLILCVHDELQFDVLKEHAERVGQITREAMKRVEAMLKMNCPLDAEYKIGKNWAQTH